MLYKLRLKKKRKPSCCFSTTSYNEQLSSTEKCSFSAQMGIKPVWASPSSLEPSSTQSCQELQEHSQHHHGDGRSQSTLPTQAPVELNMPLAHFTSIRTGNAGSVAAHTHTHTQQQLPASCSLGCLRSPQVL